MPQTVFLAASSKCQYLGPAGKVGFSKAMSAGWITLDKTAKPPLVKRKVASIEDNVQVITSTPFALLLDCVKLLVFNGAPID